MAPRAAHLGTVRRGLAAPHNHSRHDHERPAPRPSRLWAAQMAQQSHDPQRPRQLGVIQRHIQDSNGLRPADQQRQRRDRHRLHAATPLLEAGTCTHEDVRSVLQQALTDGRYADRVRDRLVATMRALIVDEVFDANDLDIAVIELAINAGVAVTLVGDPWQALYVFRGARPEAVPELLRRTGARTLPLTRSFRWQDDIQRDLAGRLRAGKPVTLPSDGNQGADFGVDVVLGLFWKPLWEVGSSVLPLAFQAFKGGTEEA